MALILFFNNSTKIIKLFNPFNLSALQLYCKKKTRPAKGRTGFPFAYEKV